MAPDPALEWLLADQESSGLTISEYERQYGVILENADGPLTSRPGRRARRHEITAGLMTDGDIALAERFAARLRSTSSGDP